MEADAGDGLVVPGGQAGLATAMRALAQPGSAVLVEVPAYVGALAAAQAARLRPVPVPTDQDGVRADLPDEAFARSGARLLNLQPTYANPTGSVLAPERSCWRTTGPATCRWRARLRPRCCTTTPTATSCTCPRCPRPAPPACGSGRSSPAGPPPIVPRGGRHLCLSLPNGTDDLDLSERTRSHHLLAGAGHPCSVTEAPGPRLRLSFAVAAEPQLTAGVRVLAELLQSLAS